MNPLYHVTINGRTYSPRTFNRYASANITVGFRDAATRADTIAFVARLYGVDNRRAFQIARHFVKRSDRLRALPLPVRCR
ncbi:hypothetical protein [Streptomyces chryseus]|uniref:hypothetical protein n=1 Tax=Streptomyces chryseus TaxID=68186 RepID=UPI00110F8458|nr:hypothetical protein [Streptomyces chryseus]GGX26568.1 hypothetical protein GCM10010353_47010 [Streptomyces chryseus]